MGILQQNQLPTPYTEEAKKERERFMIEVRKQIERARQVSLTVLIWGQPEDANIPISRKRINIRDFLVSEGHNALFSEGISHEGFFKGLSEKSREFAQVKSAHLIVILLEGSPGALAEAHDFCNHPDLAEKFYVMFPKKYEHGYSAQGAIKDLDEGFGGVYWYEEGEIESCNVLNVVAKRVQARRNIMYRHLSTGDSI